MNQTFTLCDRSNCLEKDSKHAISLCLFKERNMDAAGSNEDWSYTFDLCEKDRTDLLRDILDELRFRAVDDIFILRTLENMGIKTRVE
jgi:hypothetical protein